MATRVGERRCKTPHDGDIVSIYLVLTGMYLVMTAMFWSGYLVLSRGVLRSYVPLIFQYFITAVFAALGLLAFHGPDIVPML